MVALGLFAVLGQRLGGASPWLLFLAAVITGYVALVDYFDVRGRIIRATAGSSLISASTGAGLWAIFIGAALIGAAGVMLIVRRHTP